MNILYIGHEKDLNGASRSLLNIIDEMLPENRIFVLTAYSSGPFYEELSKRKVTIIVKEYYRWIETKYNLIQWMKQRIKWNAYRKKTNKKCALEMVEIVRNNKIDIIHVNSVVINIGALIKQHTNVKLIWHIREFADLDFHMFPLVSLSQMYNMINVYADRVICVSRAIYEHYKLIDDNKKCVIYNGVSKDCIILDSEKETHPKEINFLITGRISPEKGQNNAISAFKEVYDRGYNNIKILLAGPGQLEVNIPPYLKERIILLGNVNNMEEVRKIADIELVCSRAEAFGRVTVEAMLAGIPVIGSNTGGTPELVRDGETGFLYDYNNNTQLADKMELMIKNTDMRMEFGIKAREIAMENYLITRCTDQITEVYKEILNQ